MDRRGVGTGRAANSADAGDAGGDARALWPLFVAVLANFCALGMFFTVIPLFVTGELGGSRAASGLAVGSFYLTSVLLRPAIGRGVDARGRRFYLALGLAVLALTSLLFLPVRSVSLVVGLRLVQGIAGAAFYTAAAATTADLAPVDRRASAIAKLSLFLYGGFAVGPALGEQLVRSVGFGPAWLTAAGFAGAGLVAVRFVPETAEQGRPDVAPLRGRLRLHPVAILPGLVLLSATVGYTSITAFSALYAASIGLEASGGLYLTFAGTIIAVRLVVIGGFVDRRGRRSVACSGMSLASLGLGVLATVPTAGAAYLGVSAFGAGFALAFPALMAYTVDRAPLQERGAALGTFVAFADTGNGVGSYAVGALADLAGFGVAYGVPAALCAVGAVVAGRRLVAAHPRAITGRAADPGISSHFSGSPPRM